MAAGQPGYGCGAGLRLRVSQVMAAASRVMAAGQPAHGRLAAAQLAGLDRTAGLFKPVWTAQRAGWLGG